MKKNEAGFPDYDELRLKLDLDNNDILRQYIDYMYETYNQLYDETYDMLPEEVRFLKDLKYTLITFYKDELKNDKSITEIDNHILALLMCETDYRAAIRDIFKAYLRECTDYFNKGIKSLFRRDK